MEKYLDLPPRFQFTGKIKATRQATYKYLCDTLPTLELEPVPYKALPEPRTLRMYQIIPSSMEFGKKLEAKYKNVKCFVVPADKGYRRLAVVSNSTEHQYIVYQATLTYSSQIYVLDTSTYERTIVNNLQDAIDYIEVATAPLERLPLLVHQVEAPALKKAILKRFTEGA